MSDAGAGIAMWFGTMSTTMPRPCSCAVPKPQEIHQVLEEYVVGQANQALTASEVHGHRAVVHDVVPVHRARSRLQDRREVEVRDPQAGEVRHDLGGTGEAEPGVELEPVGRRRDGPVSHAAARRANEQ